MLLSWAREMGLETDNLAAKLELETDNDRGPEPSRCDGAPLKTAPTRQG
jgi:hypothetical protein